MRMTSRVLLPLDGSEKDQRAGQVADAFATLLGGSIHIVRVFETRATHISAGMALLNAPVETGVSQRAYMEQSLARVASQLSTLSGHQVTWEVIDGADVASEIQQRARHGADVIVMATRGPGTLARAFLGSVADEVVRKSLVPVVVVPPGARYGAGQPIGVRRALVPIDGSDASLSAIDALFETVDARKLECVLMRVVREERTGGYMRPEPVRTSTRVGDVSADSALLHVQAARAEEHLEELAKRLRARGNTAVIRVVESNDPAAAILSAIRDELVDLIAMSTHGEGGLRRVLHGSVANRVARESEVPVFLVTPVSSTALAANATS